MNGKRQDHQPKRAPVAHQLESEVQTTIRALLKLSGKTQQQLAEALEVDPGSVTKRLNGKTQITLGDFARIGDFFDVPLTVFVDTRDEFNRWVYENRPEWIHGIDLREDPDDPSDQGVPRSICDVDEPDDLSTPAEKDRYVPVLTNA